MLYISPFAAAEIFETARELGYNDRTKLERHLQNLQDREGTDFGPADLID